MENKNKIEQLAELFRRRDKVEQEIMDTLGMGGSVTSPETITTSQELKPKRKYNRVKIHSDEASKKGSNGICSDCGRPHKLLIKGMCPSCYARNRKKKKKDIGTGKIKEVYRYECLDCGHKWTSFNNPADEASREACPECESKMVKW